ncbi:T9SS type A sorting domain-containing protein [Flavobacterium sp. ENC]|uniref:T9SS type A sorting domain-containing protein n=1 Tax=Flavobacterium sp. ENC TaxID=2897330 RepID=UPI001E334A4D|nr:T9SS type A sorting domain-containing protein [Flavobacterium sp. ENC]
MNLSGYLETFDCTNTALKSIELSNVRGKISFDVSDNKELTFFNTKNGYINSGNLYNCPKIKFICADDDEVTYLQNSIDRAGYTNLAISSYCSFTPGGTYYVIQGNHKLDSNMNGCDDQDIVVPNLKFTINDGVKAGNIISNFSGSYSIPVKEGTHTITPVFENPDYYIVSPTNLAVSFPAQASPFVQNFCITANGVHQDLEVSLLPITRARPGFDAKYKLIYKNKGNQIQSGSINLNFDDNVLDLVVANPLASTQTVNNLSWNFSNLKPFESREIAIILKLNKPTDKPAVNNGDILKLSTTITSETGEETPLDNTFILNQTVVGSFDPNDKACLEGSVITPGLIGEYVHYMIRFENTGTYPAQNIVVKDMIDLNKFDISTLIPTSSSHPFVTKISEGNKVEFIFENVNLPFDNATNDGYVAFKIKTKPTLVAGDSFTNEANIYFDYNFPILTNKATSTFKTLGTQDFEFSSYLSLYPVPVTDILNIHTTQTIEIKALEIYDILGQIVIAVPNAQSVSGVDVSKLRAGNYFIKIKSDKGNSSMKFIKK